MKAQVYLTTKVVLYTTIILYLTAVSYGVENQIISVDPNSVYQGETGLTITFTLDTDAPPAPPAEVLPQSVTIGDIAGTSIAHPSQYTVTAVFDITSIAGVNDVEVTFETPKGTLVFSMNKGFTIIEATDMPPSITTQPQSQTIASGNPVTFMVGAWGTQPLSYQWFKDDISIPEANDSSFTIESVNQSDQGNYSCLVMNDYGYMISKEATLTVSTETPFEGYNLFSPMMSTETYLMDNDGNYVHSWSSDYGVGLSVYFLEDGTLLRTANTGGTSFDVGGAGGRVEQYNWDNDLLWSYDYNSSEHRLHHDIEKLPNGNILMIAWEFKTEAEAITAGRDPSLLAEGQLWPDYVIEVEPTDSSGGNIVWQWHVWDHLIQDYDSTKPNYGTIADHPEKINLNFVLNGKADWNHFNSIDYNAELDQILLSVHNFGEIWIIDHNTTTTEVAGSTGDILYRWGNPQTYDMGSPDNQQLFAQHDAEWIESGLPGEGDILIFNNGLRRTGGNYSSVDQITPPVDANGAYMLDAGSAYGPDAPTWTYSSTLVTDFFAERISGAQRLADGHTLICEGTTGRLFEVTSDGTVVWEYEYGSEIFRVERYSPDYPGFTGTELEPEPLPVMQYPIVDTGQVKCYDNTAEITAPAEGEAFYGQDAQFNGNQPDYTLSGDGLTVKVNVTGLTWTQSPDWNGDGTINSNDKFTFDETQAYPEKLNAEQFGGYNDWRVPTIKELYSLMDFRGTDPMVTGDDTSGLVPFIDTDYFAFGYGDTAAGERIIDAQFCTNTVYVSTVIYGQRGMFGLNLADGRIKCYPIDEINQGYQKTFYALFVRGNLDYGINNLVDNGDGTITDEATELMWSQDDSDVGMNWEDALAWVQTKNVENYLGYNDWRLPNAKEMQSIVDYTRSPDTTGSAAIDPAFNTTQITNEASQTDYPFFWSSTTHIRFDGNGSSGVYICFGRGMGTMDGINAIDVHGAGCQRSDPKDGNPEDYPSMGNGPQGDVQRVFNYVRLVRDDVSSQLSYPLVDTGQSTCYDRDGAEIASPEAGQAYAGQDAQYDGTLMSYTDNGDGTVIDNVTGLMWQQTPASYGVSWQEAADYCESLELAGYDDWRMPTTKELFSISDFSQGWPYLDTTYFNLAGSNVSKDEQYWTEYYVGTTIEGGTEAAFGINHCTGHIKAYPANASGHFGNYVRAVRGDTYGINGYVDNGDGTITDRATGLMWSQADSGVGMDWEAALAYAENSTVAGYDDWRLPNIKELQSIVDYTKSPSASDPNNLGPAIDTNYFNITELEDGTTAYSPDYGYFWSSTSAYFGPPSPEYHYAWYVGFGTTSGGDGYDLHGAGGVRFDTKYEGGSLGEGGERYYNYVRLVRDINYSE